MEARATGEAQSHLQNAGLGAALKGPPSPLTLISLSPSMGSPGAQDHHPRTVTVASALSQGSPYVWRTSPFCAKSLVRPPLPSTPCPPPSLPFLTLTSPTSVPFRDLVNNYPLLYLNLSQLINKILREGETKRLP